ncbi:MULTISPECIES: signal peptidase II [Crystallibacter]|uniref:signal peptidase II n=1 Tax=Crystallibacter TaxID=3456524 RepID=UPI0014766AAA|nr:MULTISPECIES: signal peptidase II [unclassified Arthrobacter]MCW2133432.1 signal peptidase II [Arthrobacter sp. VKM Ac-2550]NMR31948.1 signal peptidase II [Arthrobacter sp. SF27]
MSAESTARTATPIRAGRRVRAVLLVWAAVLAAADLAVKSTAEALLSGGATADLGVLNFRLLYNPGVAFSFGADLPDWVIIAATGLIIAGLVWYALSSAPTMTRVSRAGAGLLLGGAAGNFIDRLDGRGVVDYLHTGWFPTFNLADIFVTAGVALFVLGAFLQPRTGTDT